MKKEITALAGLLIVLFTLPLQACQSASGDSFEVLSLDVAPGNVVVNEKFTVTAGINNASGRETSYSIPVMVNGIADERETVILGPGKSKEIQYTLAKSSPGQYEIAVGNKTASITVEAPVPAAFKLSEFTINNKETGPGKEIVVTARITNTGGSEGTYIAELSINGTVEQSERTVIPKGVNYNCVFKLAKNNPGTYTVAIGDLSGTFTVVKPIQTIQVTSPAATTYQRKSQRASSCCPGGDTSGCE